MIFFYSCILLIHVIYAQQSYLWPSAKDYKGRLLDYSYAGYKGIAPGYPARPQPPVTFSTLRTVNPGTDGVVGDGQTDDTLALRQVLLSLPSKDAALYLGPGTYKISGTFKLTDRENFAIRGAGPEATVLKMAAPPSTASSLIEFSGSKWWGGKLLATVSSVVGLGERRIPVNTPGADAVTWLTTPGAPVVVTMREPSQDAKPSLVDTLCGDVIDSCDASELHALKLFNFVSAVDRVERDGASGPILAVWLKRPLPLELKTYWQAQLLALEPAAQNVGVDGIGIRFEPVRKYKGHNLDPGDNAISFTNVIDGYVRNVLIHNADNAVAVEDSAFLTVSGLTLSADKERMLEENLLVPRTGFFNTSGHFGVAFRGSDDSLVEQFHVKQEFTHDVSFDLGSRMNVVRNGRGTDLNIDFHRGANWGQLISNCNFGQANRQRPFDVGGPVTRGIASWRSTIWNVYAGDPTRTIDPLPEQKDQDTWQRVCIACNWVGIVTSQQPEAPTTLTGRYLEATTADRRAQLTPPELMAVQVVERFMTEAPTPQPTPTSPPTPIPPETLAPTPLFTHPPCGDFEFAGHCGQGIGWLTRPGFLATLIFAVLLLCACIIFILYCVCCRSSRRQKRGRGGTGRRRATTRGRAMTGQRRGSRARTYHRGTDAVKPANV